MAEQGGAYQPERLGAVGQRVLVIERVVPADAVLVYHDRQPGQEAQSDRAKQKGTLGQPPPAQRQQHVQRLDEHEVHAQVVGVEQQQRRQHVAKAIGPARPPPPAHVEQAGQHHARRQQAVVAHFLRQVNVQVGQRQQQGRQEASARAEQGASQRENRRDGDHANQHAEIAPGELSLAAQRAPDAEDHEIQRGMLVGGHRADDIAQARPGAEQHRPAFILPQAARAQIVGTQRPAQQQDERQQKHERAGSGARRRGSCDHGVCATPCPGILPWRRRAANDP